MGKRPTSPVWAYSAMTGIEMPTANEHDERRDRRVEREGTLVVQQPGDHPHDPEAVVVGAQLAGRPLGAVLEPDRHLGLRHAGVDRVHGELGLDLEGPRDGRERLDEPAGEHAVAAEHVVDRSAEDDRDDPVEDPVAQLVARPVGAGLAGDAHPGDLVVGALEQHPHHLGGGGRVVGVVAVDHQVDVGVEVGHRPADDVALAAQGLAPHLGAGGLGHLRGAVGAVVVVDVDRRSGARRPSGRRRPWRPRAPRCGTARSRRCARGRAPRLRRRVPCRRGRPRPESKRAPDALAGRRRLCHGTSEPARRTMWRVRQE